MQPARSSLGRPIEFTAIFNVETGALVLIGPMGIHSMGDLWPSSLDNTQRSGRTAPHGLEASSACPEI